MHVEGEAVEITALTAITAAVDWKVRAGVFVGLGDDEFYIREIDGENLVVEGPFAATENSAELCTWGIDSSAADIFALTTTELAVYDHEGAKQTPSALLEKTTTTDCTDLKLATANKAAFVLDNQSQTLYEIDKEAVVYHVHGTETLSVNDVVSAVSFHEIDSEGSHEDH